MNKPQADEIVRRVLTIITRVAPFIALQLAPVGTEDFYLIAVLGELPVGMRDFAPPETDGPSGLLGHRWVRHNNCNALCVVRIKDVDFDTHAFSFRKIQDWIGRG